MPDLMQIAPKELLTARRGMTKTTDRLLTSPPVPLQLSSVQPGSEFPDPSDIALATDKKVNIIYFEQQFLDAVPRGVVQTGHTARSAWSVYYSLWHHAADVELATSSLH